MLILNGFLFVILVQIIFFFLLKGGKVLSQLGFDGLVSIMLFLFISVECGFVFVLVLYYSSGGGNGFFGVGWFCVIMSIVCSISYGVLQYNDSDEFLGLDGEVLV